MSLRDFIQSKSYTTKSQKVNLKNLIHALCNAVIICTRKNRCKYILLCVHAYFNVLLTRSTKISKSDSYLRSLLIQAYQACKHFKGYLVCGCRCAIPKTSLLKSKKYWEHSKPNLNVCSYVILGFVIFTELKGEWTGLLFLLLIFATQSD